MILPAFIIVLYVTYMRMIKYIIGPVEHLVIVIAFATLLMSIVRCEDRIIDIVKYIDGVIGWGPAASFEAKTQDTTSPPHGIAHVYSNMSLWIAKDYKHSHFRRLVNRVKSCMKYFLLKGKTNGD